MNNIKCSKCGTLSNRPVGKVLSFAPFFCPGCGKALNFNDVIPKRIEAYCEGCGWVPVTVDDVSDNEAIVVHDGVEWTVPLNQLRIYDE